MVTKWCRIDGDATSSRRIDVNTTSFLRHVPAGDTHSGEATLPFSFWPLFLVSFNRYQTHFKRLWTDWKSVSRAYTISKRHVQMTPLKAFMTFYAKYDINVGWVVNGPLRQYFSLYRAVSQKREMIDERKKKSKQYPPASTTSIVGYCPIIQISRTPRHWKFTQHHRTTRPPLRYNKNILQKHPPETT